MRTYLAFAAAAALFLSPAAFAQQPAPTPVPQLEPGANSFTEAQAKERLEAAGYTNVSALRKDDQGIWRGTATKYGRQVNVGIDFKGNIAAS
jgi:ABC-type transport system substrate-binding protein